MARINARMRPLIEEPRGRRQRPPEGGAPGPGGRGSLLFTVVAVALIHALHYEWVLLFKNKSLREMFLGCLGSSSTVSTFP